MTIANIPRNRAPRVLLSGVFGPFGVDDAYGRKENIMELFHNQVTKAQGAASLRFFHRSFGLYFIAENLDAEVTVLDFPSEARFARELRRGYDVVGISFIAPNFVKARRMAELVRRHAPGAHIVLGGHGAAIEGVEELIDCDQVVQGEGIGPMRRLLGQDPDGPVVHPVLPSAEQQYVYGVPVPSTAASLLVPGVGCVNGCKFCSTSHFFDRSYTSFIGDGRQLFRLACHIADQRGTDDFFIMDENFLKDRQRALTLVEEMERHGRFFQFSLFSSAETIHAFGVDNMQRLGASFVWIGVESSSPRGNFEKNRGIDARELVQQLRDRGITVLASGILCQEHHTQQNIQHEIDFMVGLEADLVQFMLLTPLPVTALYRDHQQRGLLRHDLPLEEWHGQKQLSYRHPHFPGDAAERWITAAFRQDYQQNSSSLYRMLETAVRGAERLRAMPSLDPCLTARLAQLERRARAYAPILPTMALIGVNARERRRARALDRRLTALFGPPTVTDRAKRAAVGAIAAAWTARLRLIGDTIQPRTLVSRYPAHRATKEPGHPCRLESGPRCAGSGLNLAARVALPQGA